MPKNYPGLNTPSQVPPVPGVDYKPLAPPPAPKNVNKYPGLTSSRTREYNDNLRVIEEAQRMYQEQAAAAQQAEEKARKKKAPMWAKALGYGAKALQYTSVSEWTRNAPVIGEYQKKLERIPGARTFLAAASNPLTYLGGAGVGVTGARAIATAGLASAAGAAAGEAALSEEGLGLDIPLVSEKYEGMVGGIVGGIASPMGAARVMGRGIGGLPGVGGLVPEGAKSFGMDARVAAKFAADAQLKAERAALRAGKPSPGTTMFSADGGKTATFREPTPTKNAIQMGWDEVANPTELFQTAPIGDSNYVYVSIDKPTSYNIASTAVRKGSRFYDNLDDVEPGEAVVRVKRKYVKFDKQTGRPMAKVDILPGQVDVFTRDARGGELAWKQIAGLAADADGPKWTKFTVADEGEASKWFHDGEKWVYAETPEEFAALQEAEKAARIAEASQVRGADVQVPPMPQGQLPLAMQTAQQGTGGTIQFRNPRTTMRAPDITEGLEPAGKAIYDDIENPRWAEVIADTATPDGGSSTNILGEKMVEGVGLSINPERTRVIPMSEWQANPQQHIQQFAADNADILQDPKKFLGTWHDPSTGNVSLDIGSNIMDEAEGMRLMEQYNQKAMWRASDGAVIENPRYDPTRGPEAMAAGTADEAREALPRVPDPKIQQDAKSYVLDHEREFGLNYDDLRYDHEYMPPLDPESGTAIARAFEEAPDIFDPATDPAYVEAVKDSYAQFGREIQAQWDDLAAKGMRFEPAPAGVDPYTSRPGQAPDIEAVRADIQQNQHMYFFQGGDDHPLIGSATADETGLTLNDKFRAIHDYYGHLKEGMEFGPRGEENAAFLHSLMFSPKARGAMLMETRGQNNWGNYYTAGVREGLAPFQFAQQKPGILPEWAMQFDVPPARMKAAEEGVPLVDPQRMSLTHYGRQELDEIDPSFQGTGVPSEELKQGLPETRFSSFYEEGAQPEKWFVDRKSGAQRAGMVKHTVEGDFRVLDLTSPEGVAFRRRLGDRDLNTALAQAGYDGYKVGDRGTVRMFGKRPVSAVNDVPRATGAAAGTPDVTVPVSETQSGNTILLVYADGVAEDVAFGDLAGSGRDIVVRPSGKAVDVTRRRTGAPGDVETQAYRKPQARPDDLVDEDVPLTPEQKAEAEAVEASLDEYMSYRDRTQPGRQVHRAGESYDEFLKRTAANEGANTMAGQAARRLWSSLLDDVAPVDDAMKRARPAKGGAKFMVSGSVKEAGNWIPDTLKLKYFEGKPADIVHGTMGRNTVQDILGKMAASDVMLHGDLNWDDFAKMVKSQFDIDLYAPVPGKKDQSPLMDFVQERTTQWVNRMLAKPQYDQKAGLVNMRRVIDLIQSADPVSGRWYEGTLPTSYELFGEEDGHLFLKFLAATSQQKSPRDNIQLALDAFADYKLGYFDDPAFKTRGVTDGVMERLRYSIEGGEPTGKKINSFYNNLTLDDFNVTVDRWMFRIFGFDDVTAANDRNVYEIIAHQMRLIADDLGMTPREVQARLWVAARNEASGGGRGVMNVVNEPYEELMLGAGRYTEDGKLMPDLDGPEGLPTAKQTLQQILDMRERGDIDLPMDTSEAMRRADELVQETAAFRTGKVEVSLERARAMADKSGIEYGPDEDAAAILDRVYSEETGTGPRFSLADEDYDAGVAAEKQLNFAGAGFEAQADEVINYDPTSYARRSAELDEWTAANALDDQRLPDDLAQMRDDFREQVSRMPESEVAARYQKDARTTEWQKRILAEERPDSIEAPLQRGEQKSARPLGVADKRNAAAPLSAEDSATADRLRGELTRAGVPEEQIDDIIRNTLSPEQSPDVPTAGQALRGKSRAEALGANPYGLEAYTRATQKAGGPSVNGRAVVAGIGTDTYLVSPERLATDAGYQAKAAAAKQIQEDIANAPWAAPADNAFSEAVAYAANVLERTEYRVGGAPPTYGGLYFDPKSLAFYNDVDVMNDAATGVKNYTVDAAREATTIHFNPVGHFRQAQQVARKTGVSVPEALADETLDTALHEMAHDLAYHNEDFMNNVKLVDDVTGELVDAPDDEVFLQVLNRMKEASAPDIEQVRSRLVAQYKRLEDDGTLLKWENDNARISRTHFDAERPAVGQDAGRYAARGTRSSRAADVATEGVPSGATGRGSEPAGSVRGSGELPRPGATTGPAVRTGRTVVRRDLGELGTEYRGTAARRADDGTPAPTGAPRSLEPESIKVRPPRVIEEAGKGDEFVQPLPEGRMTSAPREFAEVQGDIFKNDNYRRVAGRMAKSNGLLKRVLDAGVGKSATAVEQWEKDIATYIVKREVDRSRIVGAMAELRQGKRPFVRMEGDLTKAIDWRGNEVTVPMSDVISNPKFFRLTDAQQGYVDRYHRIVTELVDDAKARGINISDSEKAGEFYTPRWVIGMDDIDIEYDYVKPGMGSKQPFEKPRFHRTAKEGMDRGIRYMDSEVALERFAESIMKRTRDSEIAERLKGLGKTASELLGEEAKVPLKVVSKRAQEAKVAWHAAERELQRVDKKEAGRAGATKSLSSNDVRALVNADDAVKTAVKERDEARRIRDDLQSKWNKAKTPKAQERLGAQLDVARNNVANAEARLKDARKTTRERITTADKTDIETRTTRGSKTVEAKREHVASLKAEYEKQMRLVKQAKGDYRLRLQSKQAPIGVRASEFPRMGLAEDVVPVRQTRELPALQGRFFPTPVMDVIEKSLADKGSKALMNVAAVNDLARMFTTSTDFGATMLQGIPVLATNPAAWAKATARSLYAWANPRSLQKYYAANREVLNEMSHYAGGLSGNEFYSSAVMSGFDKSLLGRAAQSELPVLSVPGKTVERFSVAFDAFLDVSKIEMWKALRGHAKNTSELEQLGRFVRNLTGTTSTARAGLTTTQRQVESLLMFSPRFTRSVFALGGQALQKGPGGDAARRSLAGLIAGGMFMFAATKTALHKAGVTDEPFSAKDFDPRQGGRFLSIKVGDNWIGIGGSMRGALQMLGVAGAAAATDQKQLFSTETTGLDANPFLKWARGRSSPAAGEVWNVLTGKDAIGEEYEGRGDWLSKLPDAFIPFAAQAIVETEGGAGTKAGILGGQMVGLRTFPESKSEDLNASLKDALKKMATDTPGFSQSEIDEIDEWADLTKYQKQVILQRRPELQRQLDRKEQGFWDERKQLKSDYEAAKRDLSQKYLETQRKTEAGESLTVDDLTAQQYREALADIEDRHRTAEAQLRGANAITGLGGEEFPFGPRTRRQQVINDYYNAMDAAQFVDPETGQLDFNKRDEIESQYLANLPQADRDIITQERGAEYDTVARDLKAAKLQLAPYWEIGDRIARDMGFANAAEVDVYGTERQKQIYRKRSTEAKERFRKSNPAVDDLLVRWGYASKGINDRDTGGKSGMSSKFGKKKRVLRTAL